MRNEIPATELQAFFRQLERGEIRLCPEGPSPQDIYAGNVAYTATNGWRLIVFNDANEYDYVDEVRAADSRVTDFDAIDGTDSDWRPSDEIAWRVLGIPGYCKFRCLDCGALMERKFRHEPFLCGGHTCAGRGQPAVPTWARRSGP